jgi:hypothetical protein
MRSAPAGIPTRLAAATSRPDTTLTTTAIAETRRAKRATGKRDVAGGLVGPSHHHQSRTSSRWISVSSPPMISRVAVV